MKYATYKLRISFLMSIFASGKTLYMKFVRAIAGYNHLWAVRDEAKEADELTMLFREWSNANYLLDFFLANIDDLQGFFHVEKISDLRRIYYERENIKIS